MASRNRFAVAILLCIAIFLLISVSDAGRHRRKTPVSVQRDGKDDNIAVPPDAPSAAPEPQAIPIPPSSNDNHIFVKEDKHVVEVAPAPPAVIESVKVVEEDPQVKAERLLVEAVLKLKSDLTNPAEHKAALKELERLSSEPVSNISALASMVVGDLYAGLLDTPFRQSLDLPKAFLAYRKASSAPFSEVGRAHYMIAFLTMYHPEAVTPEYQIQISPAIAPETQAEENPEESTKKETENVEDPKEVAVEELNKTLVRPNVPLAHLHFLMGARAGNIESRISMGLRYIRGQFTPKSCRHAAEQLRKASEILSDPYRDNPTPSVKLSTDAVRLDVEHSEGKSLADEEQDLIQYYQFAAERGQSVEAQIAMGLLHYLGAGNVEKDFDAAYQYMDMATRVKFDAADVPTIPADADGNALAHLGFFYLNGIGVEKNEDRAVELFTKAAAKGSSAAQMRLGLCYMNGKCGLAKNYIQAKKYFTDAAVHEEPEALYQLAIMYDSPQYGTPHAGNARLHYQRAAQVGHVVGLNDLAVLNLEGMSGVPQSCEQAVGLMRKVVEIALLKDRIVDAYREYSRGRLARALIRYEIAADLGHVLAQRNAAFLYEEGLGLNDLAVNMTEFQIQSHALYFYREAGVQESATANLKLGDYHFYGKGTDSNLERSAAFYQVATNLRQPQAAFNLGYMHQYGLGLPQDYHLAKRYYDIAVEHNPSEARFPSFFALLWMQLEQAFKKTVNKDGQAVGQTMLSLGLEWDTALMIGLGGLLLLSLIVRAFMR